MGNNVAPEDKILGETIRQKRKQHGLTLTQVAARVGLTTSFLSQLERGIVQPSITTLRKLSKALEVPIFFFLLDSKEHSPLVKRSERKKLIFPGSNLSFELLSPDLSRSIEMMLGTMEPGAVTCEEPLTHPGEECILVLKGRMRIDIGLQTFELEEGDSIYYYSDIPHKILSTGDEDLVFVSAITPPAF